MARAIIILRLISPYYSLFEIDIYVSAHLLVDFYGCPAFLDLVLAGRVLRKEIEFRDWLISRSMTK